MELSNRSGDVFLFDNVLPTDVMYIGEKWSVQYYYVYIVQEREGLWGQNEFFITEHTISPIWHYELPLVVLTYMDDLLYHPIVFGANKPLYDGQSVRIR